MIGGSHSRVEFCDLFSKENDIVHVKRYGGSSVLSHLFNQAIVSADCFFERTQLSGRREQVSPDRLQVAEHPPRTGSQDIHNLLRHHEQGARAGSELPFFSKVSLRYAVKNLRRMGFKATKLKIDR